MVPSMFIYSMLHSAVDAPLTLLLHRTATALLVVT